MKHFYGYQRATKDAPEGVDQVWLDDPTTERQERHDMMLSIARDDEGWPDGHDVYVLALGDLGKGAEANAMRKAIEGEGNRLHIIEPEPMPETRGRPRLFDPTPEQDKKIKRLYHSYNAMHYVLKRSSEIMDWDVKAHHLKRRYGNRWRKH